MQVKQGRLNFTTVVDLPEGAPVLTGTFSICGRPVTILFDSGATHSFINVKTVSILDLSGVILIRPIWLPHQVERLFRIK
jgi:hypothetical protein